jgi:hypothetical protein
VDWLLLKGKGASAAAGAARLLSGPAMIHPTVAHALHLLVPRTPYQVRRRQLVVDRSIHGYSVQLMANEWRRYVDHGQVVIAPLVFPRVLLLLHRFYLHIILQQRYQVAMLKLQLQGGDE